MLRFIANRLIWMIITLWAVFTVSFILMHLAPGGPFSAERKLDPAIERNLKAKFQLDQPLTTQYFSMLRDYLRLDFRTSMKLKDYTVNEIIREKFPISASLGILGLIFAITLGLTAGVAAAVWRGTAVDYSLMSMAALGIALPSFIVCSLAILLFVFVWPVFPAGGWGRPIDLILPAICLGAPYAAYIARLSRTGMLEVLGQDYIRTAYAKGLSKRTVILRHALKGGVLPVVSFLGPAVAGILTGSLVVEQIFAIPGIGRDFVEAAQQHDYTLCMALVMLYTVLLYSMNFLVDLSYALFDPRVKLTA
ncbi:MAG: ABC transporter permease subunit [Planctomycetota bacterium]|nr:ABC transporter permease subunit [Planctomycetota bacterium]